MNPERLFEVLKLSDVLEDTYQYDLLEAFLEVRDFEDFMQLVDDHGPRWGDGINLYRNFSWEDYGREMFNACGNQIEESLEYFFDFEAYGRYIGSDYCEEYSGGIIEIVR